MQSILDEEVTEFLGRGRSARQAAVDGTPGYRNGHGEPRRVSLTCGTVTVRRPRLRGVGSLEERFESPVLPLFRRKSEEVGSLIPELYLHGLAQGDFRAGASRAAWGRRNLSRMLRHSSRELLSNGHAAVLHRRVPDLDDLRSGNDLRGGPRSDDLDRPRPQETGVLPRSRPPAG